MLAEAGACFSPWADAARCPASPHSGRQHEMHDRDRRRGRPRGRRSCDFRRSCIANVYLTVHTVKTRLNTVRIWRAHGLRTWWIEHGRTRFQIAADPPTRSPSLGHRGALGALTDRGVVSQVPLRRAVFGRLDSVPMTDRGVPPRRQGSGPHTIGARAPAVGTRVSSRHPIDDVLDLRTRSLETLR